MRGSGMSILVFPVRPEYILHYASSAEDGGGSLFPHIVTIYVAP